MGGVKGGVNVYILSIKKIKIKERSPPPSSTRSMHFDWLVVIYKMAEGGRGYFVGGVLCICGRSLFSFF